MNREETKKAIAVMQAWLDGEEIEYCYKKASRPEWLDVETPTWDLDIKRYRVKPKPREFWVHESAVWNKYPGGGIVELGSDYIKVREVLDDE